MKHANLSRTYLKKRQVLEVIPTVRSGGKTRFLDNKSEGNASSHDPGVKIEVENPRQAAISNSFCSQKPETRRKLMNMMRPTKCATIFFQKIHFCGKIMKKNKGTTTEDKFQILTNFLQDQYKQIVITNPVTF